MSHNLWPCYDLIMISCDPLMISIWNEYFARKFLFVPKITLVKITRITTGKFFFRSRTVSNPFHDGTFCEHPRPLPHFIKARSFWSESLSWPMTSAEPNHSTWQSLAIIFIGWLINMTHTAGWVRPDSKNYWNLKFNILLLFILFRIVFSWIFLIICTFQILLI